MDTIKKDYDLSDKEIYAISILKQFGWKIACSPYVEDTFPGTDDNFKEGRHKLAVCKR